MVNQPTKIEEKDNVLPGNFTLNHSPQDVQLTIHINNLLNTYNQDIIESFKFYLYNPEKLDEPSSIRVQQIINYYGIDKCKNWFTLIYGWNFKEKAG